MSAIFVHTSAEKEHREPGIGGKPPLDRRPTGGGGGGGGDDDHDWPGRRKGPRRLLHRARNVALIALSADLVFFVAMTAIFFRHSAIVQVDTVAPDGTGSWPSGFLLPLLCLNTLILLLSSLTMEHARRSIFREMDVLEEWLGLGHPALSRARPWVAATLACGLLFLAGQGLAWRQFATQAFALDPGTGQPSGLLYALTRLHAAHLAVGGVALILCIGALGFLKRVELRQIAIDLTAWYWHGMNLTWIVLLSAFAVTH
jgi:cytochrome c oxidase subunit 3